MSDLATYLRAQVPNGMSYQDAAQLCLHLYCITEGVPKQLLPLSKEVLGDAFAELARSGWVRDEDREYSVLYGANHHQVTDRGPWVEVIASIFKKGADVVDIARGEALAREVGFVKKDRGS
jgi:hypothetical protein